MYSVRNHGGIPAIDEDAFQLEIGGLVNKPVTLSLKDLKDPAQFPYVSLIYLNLYDETENRLKTS